MEEIEREELHRLRELEAKIQELHEKKKAYARAYNRRKFAESEEFRKKCYANYMARYYSNEQFREDCKAKQRERYAARKLSKKATVVSDPCGAKP